MDRRLLTSKWILTHLVVAGLAAAFVVLGVWQLDRLEQRREMNMTVGERFALPPVPFETLEQEKPSDIEYRRVVVVGRVLNDQEVLIRSRTHQGVVGYHLILPISHRGAGEVLINRGWVPLGTEVGTTQHYVGEEPVIRIEGWIHRSQERPPLGPEDPPGQTLTVMNRVDIERIQEQTDPRVDIADVYIVEIGERGSSPPFPVEAPDFSDEGPHLGYAIQWFGFAAILLIGYVFLVRKRLRTSA